MWRLSRCARPLILLALAAGPGSAGRATELEQIVSRENPTFQPPSARLTVGRDGLVYLCSGGSPSFVLRLRPDGSDKVGGKVVYAAGNATANRDGVLATANAHFNHKVTFYGRGFDEQAAVVDFLANDA